MEAMIEVLEQELEGAFEVKDKKSLHRYVLLLTENIVKKENYEKHQIELKNDIRILAENQKQGFEMMNKRFEAIDNRFKAVDNRFEDMYRYMEKRFESVDNRFKDMYRYMEKRFESVDNRFKDINSRFEDMNKRFSSLFLFMNLGMGTIILLTILFKFIH